MLSSLCCYDTNGKLRLRGLLIRLSSVLFRAGNGRKMRSGGGGSGTGRGRGIEKEDVLTAGYQKIE